MTITAIYDRLAAAASIDGNDAAIRLTARYEPVGGPQDKVSPPTYLVGDRDNLPYLFEQRWDGDGKPQRTVLLDSRQAQANRCEEALLAEVRAGRLALPYLEMQASVDDHPIRISSLEAPHRSRDAYFRDSTDEDRTPFDETEAGEALRGVRPEDASALYHYAPTDLVYGVWDSHRKLRLAPRFPRVYTSETIGCEVLDGRRAAGRYDLVVSGQRKVIEDPKTGSFEAGDGRSGSRLSELGHGSIPPSVTVERKAGSSRTRVLGPGGVTVREIRRTASLGFAGLARVSFGEMPQPAQRAARAALAALALLADRLAFAGPGLFLRSGCELVLVEERLEWVGRLGSDGAERSLDLDVATARELAGHAIAQTAEAGAAWAPQPIVLRPNDDLQHVIKESFYKQPSDEE